MVNSVTVEEVTDIIILIFSNAVSIKQFTTWSIYYENDYDFKKRYKK